MPFVDVYIHGVWRTKRDIPFLSSEVKKKVIDHIRENARNKGIYIKELNGHVDHLHCLFGLPAELSISKVMMLIKGESSFWINKNKITKEKVEWADEYYAASVSAFDLDGVNRYIQDQEEHHRVKTFQEEYDEFFKTYEMNGSGLKPNESS
jgi:putative transposase